ncbi:hypothetical protein [Lysobacter gummosus]
MQRNMLLRSHRNHGGFPRNAARFAASARHPTCKFPSIVSCIAL